MEHPARRTAILAAAIYVLVAVAACSNGKPGGAGETGAAPAASPAAPAASSGAAATGAAPTPADASLSDDAVANMLQPWQGDLDGMVKRRYIRVLVTFSRTNYFIDHAEQRGATHEAGHAFEAFLNKRLKTGAMAVSVAFIPVRRDRLLQSLVDGRGDIAAASLTITPEREALVDFAAPLVSDVREIVVTGKGAPALQRPEDLSGRDVYVRRSSSYFASLGRLNQSLRQSGRPPVRVIEADEQLEDEDLLEMVNANLIPATVVDNHLAAFWQQVFDGIEPHENVAIRTDGRIAWAIRKGSPQLKAVVDAFASTHGQGTLMGNVVLQRYLKNADYVKNSTSEAEQRKFRELVSLFRMSGDKYDLPWLLLAAQGYQESQLDQSRRSPAGAVGVMQLKPSTAEGPPVFIKGVDKSTERNIEAGAKYLRFIVDEYYKDEPMDRLTKGLFALASYNAGPARVAGLRRKAARMGLDPNLWFQNVEVVAAREIGRETVQYVANIYKYYVAYKLISEQREPGGGKKARQP
jgi:membrane-bound lytic murein transglycosylase MltF